MVERVTITAVRPNLISMIDRIRLNERPSQLDIHSRTEGERERVKRGGSNKSTQKLFHRKNEACDSVQQLLKQ